MVFAPMVPVAGAVFLFLVVVAFVVLTGITGPARGRVPRISRRILIALALLIVGLRPGIPDFADKQVVASDVDVFIAMDTTGSIAAEDYNGTETRLDGMRGDVAEILLAFPGARVTLVTFDAVAIIRVPLTRDTSTIQSAMDVVQTEVTTYSNGSTISEPRQLLEDTLAASRESYPDHKRILIYLGDGEQTASGDPESFESVTEYIQGGAVLGYGTEDGGQMLENKGAYFDDPYYYDDEYYEEQNEPKPAPTYIQDPRTNEPALSVIDETNLEAIAEQLGVTYEHRTEPGEIPALEGLNNTDDVVLETTSERSTQELYWIFALAAFVLLLWEAGVVAIGIVDAFAASRRRA
jgi:Ca-activated chloride channel homolog